MIEVLDFGCAPFSEIWALQLRLLAGRLAGQRPDTLLVGEHPPVYTSGRRTQADGWRPPPNLPAELAAVERGGEATFHGPGQLMAYPILALPPDRRDLHRYLRDLEAVSIQTLAEFGLEGFRKPGLTGVWVLTPSGREGKIASIGVAVRKWVTYHGVALNIHPDMRYFQAIQPCGLPPESMTAMAACLDPSPGFRPVQEAFVRQFIEYFRFLSES